MKRTRLSSSRRKKMSHPVTIACRRWSMFGVPRRYCKILLWPEKRLNKDSIWRTQNDCTLHIRKEFVPFKKLQRLADSDGYINFGMIPKGTPINLVGNLEPNFRNTDLFFRIGQKLIKL